METMKTMKIFLIFIIFITFGCNEIKTDVQNKTSDVQNKMSNSSLYQQAMEIAMYPTESKVYKNLTQIIPENKDLIRKKIDGENYILVATWGPWTQKTGPVSMDTFFETYKDSTYFNSGDPNFNPIWVTVAPELLKRMKKEKYENADLRLAQLFGMPPNTKGKYFVEFWVKPGDLFRPCPDNEITDRQCDVCLSKKTDSSYVAWINNQRINSYYQCDLNNEYPWTQLGYTFDWNPENKSNIGLSEFVVRKNSNMVVNAVYTTEEYLNKDINTK